MRRQKEGKDTKRNGKDEEGTREKKLKEGRKEGENEGEMKKK